MVQLAFYYKRIDVLVYFSIKKFCFPWHIVNRMTVLLTTTFFFLSTPQMKNFPSGTSEYLCSLSVAYKTLPCKEEGLGHVKHERWNLAIGPRVLVFLDSPADTGRLVLEYWCS